MAGTQSRGKFLKLGRSLVFLALVCLTIKAATAAETPTLRHVTMSQRDGHTFFEAELTTAVAFSVSATASPNKVTIALPPLKFNLPRGSGRNGAGAIIAYHYGLEAKTASHIVLDTREPVVINASVITPAASGKPAHLTVDLVSAAAPSAAAEKAADQTDSITPAAPAPQRKFIIAIDPGHGGMDPGALSANGTREKEVVLAFAQSLRSTLERTGRYSVVMTRESDKFIKLENRVQFARDAKADLFIAVHADTLDDDSVRGTTLYTVSDKASDAMAEALAAKENRADIITGMDLGKQTEDVANLLINLAQRESRSQATLFARTAVNALRPVTQLTAKPVRSAAFVVLKAPDVPSVLVELGYLSNREDEKALRAPEWQNRMASAMAKAIDSYFTPLATALQ
jgi:N-acetylmuramoyl-L-alanine amidase